MLEGIDGKVALVTGAARRRSIGRATALRLAKEGADVACLDIARPYEEYPGYAVASGDELDEVVAEIEQLGRRALALRADVRSAEEVGAAVAQCVAELGRVDLCCNVAGGAGFGMGAGPLLTLPDAEFRQVLDVNLVGTFLVSQACAADMVKRGEPGRIVNVSSQAGKIGFAGIGAYSAAKAGVLLLTQVLAKELGPAGILVNAVCPGTVNTNLVNPDGQFETMMDAMHPGGAQAWIDANIPLGRLQEPEEVASVIAFLCSDDARYVTGEGVNVSGGQTMA